MTSNADLDLFCFQYGDVAGLTARFVLAWIEKPLISLLVSNWIVSVGSAKVWFGT